MATTRESSEGVFLARRKKYGGERRAVYLQDAVKYWPTPNERDWKGAPGKNYEAYSLPREVAKWPTPDVRGFSNAGSLKMLSRNVESRPEFDGMAYRAGAWKKNKLWPTVTSRDYKDGTSGNGRTDILGQAVGPTRESGSLNPAWVEWLMGYPLGWTDLRDSETP
jgi:hypothetical protein